MASRASQVPDMHGPSAVNKEISENILAEFEGLMDTISQKHVEFSNMETSTSIKPEKIPYPI